MAPENDGDPVIVIPSPYVAPSSRLPTCTDCTVFVADSDQEHVIESDS